MSAPARRSGELDDADQDVGGDVDGRPLSGARCRKRWIVLAKLGLDAVLWPCSAWDSTGASSACSDRPVDVLNNGALHALRLRPHVVRQSLLSRDASLLAMAARGR